MGPIYVELYTNKEGPYPVGKGFLETKITCSSDIRSQEPKVSLNNISLVLYLVRDLIQDSRLLWTHGGQYIQYWEDR